MIKVTYVDHMGSDLSAVRAARVSFGKTSDTLTEKDIKLIDYLAKHDHLSPFEHCTLTLLVECPLYIRSQIHRHRTFAYNEVSRRYTADNLEFYVAPTDDIRAQSKSNKQASDGPIGPGDAQNAVALIKQAHAYSLEFYNQLIALGVSREQARGVLPQNLLTKFYMTGNLRNYAHFVRLRVDSHAQAEVRVVGEGVKAIMLDKFPYAASALFKYSAKVG